MNELIQKFIGKECIIYTMNSESESVCGTISELKDGWLFVSSETESQIVNIEYVVRIREYPRNKKGKKKAIVD